MAAATNSVLHATLRLKNLLWGEGPILGEVIPAFDWECADPEKQNIVIAALGGC